MRQLTDNQDYVAALVHGRRSGMAEGPRLEALCRSRSLPDFARDVLPGEAGSSAEEIEYRLVNQLAREILEIVSHLSGPAAPLLLWVGGRFQLENLKILIRHLLTGAPGETFKPHLVPLPGSLDLNMEKLAGAESLRALLRLMPNSALRRSLAKAVDLYHEQPRPFFLESALDTAYFGELLSKTEALREADCELVRPFIVQEIDLFHLMLVTRGKLIYGLELEALRPFHVGGTNISKDLFEAMLGETELRAVAARAVGRVVDALAAGHAEPGPALEATDAGGLERLAWARFQRLVNRAFRRSHMGAAAVVAYVELRRVEVANLITICEGIRAGLPAERIHSRLTPFTSAEAVHV